MPELIDEPAPETSEALFTVVAGEGDGFLLGLAAGDAAGGAWELGYSAATEQATVLAYQLIEHREIDKSRLIEAFLELDGARGEEPVFRAESSQFRLWLDRARAGEPVPGSDTSLDAAVRATVIGVGYRRDPSDVVGHAIDLGRVFHSDARTVAAGVVAASAVAASCFAQSGLDLIAGVAESAGSSVGNMRDLDGSETLQNLRGDIEALIPAVGVTTADEALATVDGPDDDPLTCVLAALLLSAPVAHRHHVPIEQGARLGGSSLGAVVGAIVGARVGIRAWPWAFANDTWFAEIGRRLVRGPDEVRDLPIPYAVEHHLMSGGRPGFH